MLLDENSYFPSTVAFMSVTFFSSPQVYLFAVGRVRRLTIDDRYKNGIPVVTSLHVRSLLYPVRLILADAKNETTTTKNTQKLRSKISFTLRFIKGSSLTPHTSIPAANIN